MKSCRCSGSSAASASSCSSLALGHDQVLHERLRSPRNMCSVRHRPMPCGAEAAGPGRVLRGVGVGAHRRAAGTRRRASMTRSTAARARRPPAVSSPSKWRTTRLSTTGTSPAKTSPVVPSMEITSPSLDRGPVGAGEPLALHVHVEGVRAADAGAAHAARDDGGVRGLAAAAGQDALGARPCPSGRRGWSRGGPGSRPRPARPTRRRSCESKTALPTAAPGEAFMPLREQRPAPRSSSKRGNISWASCAPLTRRTASSMSIRPWSTSWTAIRNAASAVRLPTRVCSIHSLPRSTVNSMSHRSR